MAREKRWIAILVGVVVTVSLIALMLAGMLVFQHYAMHHAVDRGYYSASANSGSSQGGRFEGSGASQGGSSGNSGNSDNSANSGSSQGEASSNITVDEAKQIALNHAGVTADEVTFVEAKRDYDDGRLLYEIEFVVPSGNAYKEYGYEIAAADGNILSYDHDIEGYPTH